MVLQLEHASGVVSLATLSATTDVDPHRSGVALYGRTGVLEVDAVAAVGPDAFATLGRELVAVVRDGSPHALDVRRGLHLQRILADAERQLGAGPAT